MKPIIGITTSLLTMENGMMPGLERVYVNEDYVKAVEKAGGIPLLLPPIINEGDIEKQVEMCDAFIFSGGVDVNPLCYGKQPSPKLSSTNMKMDRYQIALCKIVVEKDKPFLGICRGHQVLNVALGGTLFQDLSEIPSPTFKHVQQGKRGEVSHKILIKENSILSEIFGESIDVNSFHHQSLEKLGKDLEVIATGEDGVIEAVHLKDKKFVLGVQWHPEMLLTEGDEMLPLFKMFIEKVK